MCSIYAWELFTTASVDVLDYYLLSSRIFEFSEEIIFLGYYSFYLWHDWLISITQKNKTLEQTEKNKNKNRKSASIKMCWTHVMHV